MKKAVPYILATVIAGFGLLTLFLSTSVIFDLFGIRAKEGNYVLFVVWSNFISSILYLFAAYGFIKNKKWTTILLGISTIILIVAFVGLKIHINSGAIYETKTVGAMIFRISVTLFFAAIAYFTITRKYQSNLK
jgi:heme/copper-type cytochrome/quinol oxidase subunit 3